jgi:hypothetical protein
MTLTSLFRYSALLCRCACEEDASRQGALTKDWLAVLLCRIPPIESISVPLSSTKPTDVKTQSSQ